MLDILWVVLISYLVLFGLYFTKKLNFQNLRIIKNLKTLKKEYFPVLFMSIGTKIGVGSIIGTTIAIYTGGPGSIFWIWVFTIITSSWIYTESLLGSKYKKKLNNGFVSGPNFYIKYGLNNNKLSIIFLLILIVSYSFFFLMIQTNTISDILKINTNISPKIIYIFGFIFLFIITISSLEEIKKYINKIVPLMCFILLVVSIIVIIKNYYLIPTILKSIINSALNFRSGITGIITSILIGVKRNIFQNELLIGTTSISSAVSKNNEEDIARVQVLANMFISFIVCTLVAFLILIYSHYNTLTLSSYNKLISSVFQFSFGKFGSIILIVLILLFSFITIVSGMYFGLSNILFISNKKITHIIFRILVLIFTYLGLFIKSSFIWWIIDFMMLILIVINSICIIKLRKEVLS